MRATKKNFQKLGFLVVVVSFVSLSLIDSFPLFSIGFWASVVGFIVPWFSGIYMIFESDRLVDKPNE